MNSNNYTRRDLKQILPLLLAAQTAAQDQRLASQALRHEDLPVRKSAHISSRAMFKGRTHANVLLDIHETELAAGEAPHPPHSHIHEELVMIRSGVLDVTIAGKTTRVGPGSVLYIASNEFHGWRNPGTTSAQYFVLAVGDDS